VTECKEWMDTPEVLDPETGPLTCTDWRDAMARYRKTSPQGGPTWELPLLAAMQELNDKIEVKSLVKRALVDQEMFFVSVDYKQTVTLSCAVTVGMQYQGKMEQIRIVVIGLKHGCLHTQQHMLAHMCLSNRTMCCATVCDMV